MLFEIKINSGTYPVELSVELKNNKLIYKSELVGTTISTFKYHESYCGNTIEESLQTISTEINRALEELFG